MDKLGINKEEMLRPYKNVIIGKKVVLIDFERCHESNKPKNVTQFIQFLITHKFANKRGLIKSAKNYKLNPSLKNLKDIISLLSS